METMEPLEPLDTLLHCAVTIVKPGFPNNLYNAESILGLHLMFLVTLIMILGVRRLPWHQVTLTGTLWLCGAENDI